MRIIDVIEENPLQEAGYAAQGLELIGKGISSAYKGIKGIVDSRSLIDHLSKHPGFLKRMLQGNPPSVAEVERMFGKAAADIVRKDDTVFGKALQKYYAGRKAASKAASKSASSSVASNVKTAAGKVASGTMSIGKATTIAANLWWLKEVGELFYTSISECAEALNKIDSLGLPKEEAEQYRSWWITHTISKIAVAGVGNLLIKWVGGAPSKFLGSIHPSLGWLGKNLTTAGQIYFLRWANTPEGGNTLASYLVGTGLIKAGIMSIEMSMYNAAVDKIKEITGQANAQAEKNPPAQPATSQSGQGANPSTDTSKADKDASSTPPVTNTVTSPSTAAGPGSLKDLATRYSQQPGLLKSVSN